MATIRKKLASLDSHLPKIWYDIHKFNSHVMGLVSGLNARGQNTNDLIINLFEGYKACLDKSFAKYMEQKEVVCTEGKEISPEMLMNLASNKYKTLLQVELWNTPEKNEEKILAL